MSNLWDRFWFRQAEPHALAITRIAVGLYVLLYALLFAPNIRLLFSNEGLVLPRYIDAYPNLSFLLQAPPVSVAYLLYAVALLAIIGLITGAWFRVSTTTVIALGLYAWQLQLHLFPTSFNRILMLTLLVLLFSGAHRTFSVDQKWRTGSALHWEPVSILPQRLIALQISATFLGVSLQKWWLPQWKGGEVLAYSFIGMWSTPASRWFARLPLSMHIYDAIVLLVKIGQPLSAIGVWFGRTRMASVLFIASFILLVALMMAIWWFVYIIPACILFWDPAEVRQFLEMAERRFGLRVGEKKG